MATYNFQLTPAAATQQYPAHDHCAYVNEQYNGQTTMSAGHSHQVMGGQVLPMADGHTHQFVTLPGNQPQPCQAPQGTRGMSGCNCGR